MILQNQVLKGVEKLVNKAPKGGTVAYRFLGVDETGLTAALIDLSTKKHGGVTLLSLDTLEAAVEMGTVRTVTLTVVTKPTEGVLKFQDRAWRILELFHRSQNLDYLFARHERAQMITKTAAQAGVSEINIRYLFRRYLQGGRTKSDLRCDYVKCGTPTNGTRAMGRKVGRPSALSQLQGKLNDCDITDEIKKRWDNGIEKHVIGAQNRNVSRSKAYKYIVFEYFRHAVPVEGDKVELVFDEFIPTFDQFLYYLRSKVSQKALNRSRKTSAAFSTSDRAQLSDSCSLKPRSSGDIYVIDSTLADIYLVASHESRQLIGRPRIYLVIDYWSRMIVGFNITLGEACYEESVVAVLSVLESKEEICRSFGVKYRPEDWPLTGLAGTIVADRQEFIYHDSDLYHDRLGIHVTNCPAYHGDLKGLIEATLGFCMRDIWTLPGAVDPKSSKDESDYREDAVFTLNEFKKLVLEHIIRSNRRFISSLSLPKAVVDSGTPKVPSLIHAWGKRLSGVGLVADLQDVRTKMLPLTDTASTCSAGIRVSVKGVHGVYYKAPSEKFAREMFEGKRSIQIRVQFQASSMNVVWAEHPDTGEVHPCYLSEERSLDFYNLSWAEGAEYQRRVKHMKKQTEQKNLQVEAEMYDGQVELTNNAVERALSQGTVARSHIKKNLKNVRDEEYAVELKARPTLLILPPITALDDQY